MHHADVKMQRLVVAGCSYINYYAEGDGHQDLAQQLSIPQAVSLAKNSVCNQRILRVLAQDLYTAQEPTFYIMGLTFLSRFELAIKAESDGIDGYWQSFNSHSVACQDPKWYQEVQAQDLDTLSKLHGRFFNARHFMQDLMYRLLTLRDAAHQRGHRLLVFNTAEHGLQYWIHEPQFEPLRASSVFVAGLAWSSIAWQFEQGATWPPEDEQYPWDCRHVAPGDHAHLNRFLVDYIHSHSILP
jgi:hypothetical protein